MGRGPVIARKRDITNLQRGKIFSLYAKIITVATIKAGGDVNSPAVHDAVAKARKNNVPSENIERALKKGTGADKEGNQIEEIFYEGYGAGGTGFIVKILTDNKNRTASNIRHLFSKNGGNLAETGSLSSFSFKFAGVCYVVLNGKTLDEIEETIIESGAEDYVEEEEGKIKIITDLKDLAKVVNFLKSSGIFVEDYAPEYVPVNFIEITDFDKALKILKLIDDLEDDEDVEFVWTNYDIAEDLALKVREAIENNKFRS
ncbi:MAG: YebC/PmpR family DNA-binding transcriptional regulator [Candidatus Gracilibacteria bacterium]|nr:YebC/PmpR family DNA-binding transcriptional regulator [Candidatus Gracilibacteria bacterium]